MRKIFFRSVYLSLLSVFFLGVLWGLPACTSSGPTPDSLGLRPGQNVFSFDPKAVTELLIAKSDPKTGDKWSARFQKTPELARDLPAWKIISPPDGKSFQDTYADSSFILHLLDTVKSFQYRMEAPKGGPASFGLEPPRYAIRWKTPDKEFELRIGQPEDLDHQELGAFFQAPPISSTLMGKGALLKMLDYLSDFNIMRQNFWLPWTADEIDEVEARIGSSGPWKYAQREGDEWTDQKHKKLKSNFRDFLEQLAHARIQEFVDDPNAETAILKKVTPPVGQGLELRLTSRTQQKLILRIVKETGKKDGKIWGTASTRPGVFGLYEKTYETIQNLILRW